MAVTAVLTACNSGEPTQSTQPPVATTPPPAPPAPPAPPPSSGSPGLDARPANSSCLAWERPTAGDAITLTRYSTLTFTAPIAMLQAPGDATRWFVVEQAGRVRVFTANNPTSASTWIDIDDRVESGGEMGLLGMAFHPNFPTDPRVFLSYTAASPRRSVISEFTLAAGGNAPDPASERVLMTIPQPESNHNGGGIAFSPSDGLLYIGIGDGGGANDDHPPIGNGQNLRTLLGKIIRIDVSNTSGSVRYLIPPTNPYAASGAVCNAADTTSAPQCREIYAYGLRNPWRWSFDRSNGELWVADVGQGSREEVNRVVVGGNYGWRCREGTQPTSRAAECPAGSTLDPITEYGRDLGASITGGYVYRGAQNTNLRGHYLFGDFVSGRIFSIAATAAPTQAPRQLIDTNHQIAAFSEGNDGELYVVHYGGELYKIVFQPGAGGGAAPPSLRDTGCVNAANPQQPSAGLIPYSINAPFWSDGAAKERWIGLPGGQSILTTGGDWDFPSGTVLMKNFRLGAQLVETRLLMRHPDGEWGGFSYAWNAAQTDATLVRGGAVREAAGQQWIFPSENECMNCHTSAAGRTLGLETAQLNRDFTYTQTNRTSNQLLTLNHIGVLAPPIVNHTSEPVMADPAAGGAPLDARARAYLHTNCAQCHRPGGPTPSNMDLRYSTALNMTNACNAAPQSGDLGIGANARLIAPGSAANSLIVNRTNRRDQHAMPPLGSNQVDASGVALLTQWINALTGC